MRPSLLPVLLALAAGGCGRVPAVPDAARVAGPPQAVVAASSGVVDLLCALLPPERIAGLPAQARDYSGRRQADDPYLARPSFELYAAEPILALRPDLVVSDRWGLAETSARLREAGLAVLELGSLETLPQVEQALVQLGEALHATETARQVAGSLRARAAHLVQRGSAWSGRRALAFSHGGTGGWVAGRGTSADTFITLAGLTNAAAESGIDGHARCSFEQLLVLDPDLIIVSGRADWDDLSSAARLLRSEPALARLQAVRHDRIVVLEAWLYSTVGPHLVTAAEALAAAVEALSPEAW